MKMWSYWRRREISVPGLRAFALGNKSDEEEGSIAHRIQLKQTVHINRCIVKPRRQDLLRLLLSRWWERLRQENCFIKVYIYLYKLFVQYFPRWSGGSWSLPSLRDAGLLLLFVKAVFCWTYDRFPPRNTWCSSHEIVDQDWRHCRMIDRQS